ncbi:MAG: Protein-arginine kinase [Chlamydiae bacterium]|nr:Protein-arginine kinase [Chlamydiota bacterium]
MNSKRQNVLEISSPWKDNDNPIWLGSVLSLQRNIEKFNFPVNLSTEKRKQLVSIVSQDLLALDQLTKPYILKAEDTSPLEKDFLFEYFLSPSSFMQAHVGEAFVLDKTGKFFATLNLGDHIHFRLLDTKGDLENSCNVLENIEVALGQKVNYNFSPRFGFLTSDAADCGTAFTASVFLQLPALIHTGKLQDFMLKHVDDSIVTTGLQGTLSEIIGDLLVVRNNFTLGLSEENILSSVRSYVTKLIVHEQGLRKKLKEEESTEMKNKVSRAYGVLVHSYQITVSEALNAISLMKLGLELGWLTGVTIKELNALFFGCRRAHLLAHCGEDIDQEELPHKRAEYIHKVLQNAELHIEE